MLCVGMLAHYSCVLVKLTPCFFVDDRAHKRETHFPCPVFCPIDLSTAPSLLLRSFLPKDLNMAKYSLKTKTFPWQKNNIFKVFRYRFLNCLGILKMAGFFQTHNPKISKTPDFCNSLQHPLDQGSQTRGPQATCSPQDVFVWPASSSKVLIL